MTENDPVGFLISFLDGPLQGRGDLANAAGGAVFNVDSSLWNWPLPERIGTLSHLSETPKIAMWDAASPDGNGLPVEIWQSPNVVFYRKVNESQLPKGGRHLARGAQYKVEQ